MRNISTIKAARAASIAAVAVLGITAALASDYGDKKKTAANAPELDMVITGSNKGSHQRDDLSATSINKGDCPLCYHRELLKKSKDGELGENSQLFPGD